MDSNKLQQQQQYIYSPSFSASLPQQQPIQVTSLPIHQIQQQNKQQQSSQTTTPIKFLNQNQNNQYIIQQSQPGQALQYVYDQPKQYKVTPEQSQLADIQYDTYPNVRADSPTLLKQQHQQQKQQEKVVSVKKDNTNALIVNIEKDLEKEKNQNQILSAINNQLQNHILALETQLKSQLTVQKMQKGLQQDEENDLEDNDIAEEDDEEDDDENHQKMSKNSYNNQKIQLLEQENQQLQKVCEQLREQASRYQQTNTSKIQNSLKNLELEKSYLESTIKLEKMNVADLQMKLNQVTEEKVQIAFQLEEKNNEFEQFKIEQQMRINDQYEKKIGDLDLKANSLMEQNKKIMNINDQLLQEIDALKETNEIMRVGHQNQIDEIKTYWKQQMHEESNKLNQNLILQSQQYEQSIQQIQSQINEHQQNLLNEQQRHLKTKNELKAMQLRAEEFEQKLALSLKGNEQLMQVLEINQQDVNKWKAKFNEQQEKYIEEIEQMRTTVNQQSSSSHPYKQLSTNEQILALEEEKNQILVQLNDQIQENTKLNLEIKKVTSNNEENQQMFLEAIKLNEEMKVKIQLQNDLENRYINAQNTMQQNQRKIDNLEKKLESLLKENNKLNDQLNDRIKEVQIWQEKHKELEISLTQDLNKFSIEFQDKCKQDWENKNKKFYTDFENYQKIKEQQDQLIKDYHIEIQQLKTILTSRDEDINNLTAEYKKIQEQLTSNNRPSKKLSIPNMQQNNNNDQKKNLYNPQHLSQYQLQGGEMYYYQQNQSNNNIVNQNMSSSEDQLLLDQVNVFKDSEVSNLKRSNQELLREIKMLKKKIDELQFNLLKKEQIILQIEQDKRMLKEQVTQLHQNLNRKALSMKEKDFSLQTNYELELIIKELRDQLFLMESEKLKLQEQLFQAELRGVGGGISNAGAVKKQQQDVIDFLQNENNQLKVQLAASMQQQQRVLVNVNDKQQLAWLQQENAILKQHLSQNSAIISDIESLQNNVLQQNNNNNNQSILENNTTILQQNVLSPTQNQKINFNQIMTSPTHYQQQQLQQGPTFQKIFTPNIAAGVVNMLTGNNNHKQQQQQKENIQI